jgi:hypothetical protein
VKLLVLVMWIKNYNPQKKSALQVINKKRKKNIFICGKYVEKHM